MSDKKIGNGFNKEVEKLVLDVERSSKGTKKASGFGTHVDPKVGEKTRIKKGQRLPGAGRPKKEVLREALRKRLDKRIPNKYARQAGLPLGSTWSDAVAQAQIQHMIKAPDAIEFSGYAQETDGKQADVISGPGGGPIPLDLTATGGAYDQLRTVATRLRDRIKKSES